MVWVMVDYDRDGIGVPNNSVFILKKSMGTKLVIFSHIVLHILIRSTSILGELEKKRLENHEIYYIGAAD